MSWRLQELGRETLLNLRPAHVLLALLIGVGAWMGTAPDVAAVDRTIREFQQRIEEGATVWVLESESELNSRRCERLAPSVSSIRASGSVLAASSPTPSVMRFVQSPDVEYPVLEVTPGLVEVATGLPAVPAGGGTIGGAVAGELGVARGVVLRTTLGGVFPVSRVVDTTVRDLGFGRDVLALTPPNRPASACWFETEPWAPESTPELIRGLVAMSDRKVTLSPYSRNPVTAVGVVSDLRMRETRNSVVVTSGLLLVVVVGWVLLRRRAIITYRVANTATGERILILGGELAVPAIVGWSAAMAAIAITAETTAAFEAGVWAVTVAVPLAMLGGIAASIALGRRRIDRALKE
ncbi:MAG: hypothetical protein ACE5F5_11945 [Acidimicrobiia bacterium]